jgi:hypothetical protein
MICAPGSKLKGEHAVRKVSIRILSLTERAGLLASKPLQRTNAPIIITSEFQ